MKCLQYVHTQEGLRAVRDKASFLGEELRSQLAEAREFLAEERQLRRAAEAAARDAREDLSRHLEQASADVSTLRQQVRPRMRTAI